MSKKVKIFDGLGYVVTTATGCKVMTPEGLLLLDAPAGQSSFCGVGDEVILSDDAAIVTLANFDGALALGSQGGGVSFDSTKQQPLKGAAGSYMGITPEMLVLEAGAAILLHVNAAADLSALTLSPIDGYVPTAELWLNIHNNDVPIIWPEDAVWLNEGNAPSSLTWGLHVFALRMHYNSASSLNRLVINKCYKIDEFVT